MKLIVCLDDDNGMRFNHRRQSRDRNLIQDVLSNLNGEKLYAMNESKLLFSDSESAVEFLDTMPTNIKGYFFAEENVDPTIIDQIDTLIIYKWNRRYPHDVVFEIPYQNWELISTYDFEGSSHDKITKEVYKRRD